MIDIPNELKKVHLVLGENKELSAVYKLFLRGPAYVDKEEFQIIGVENISKPETRNPGSIGAIWAKFQALASKVSNKDQSHALGIYMTTKELIEKGENRFMIGNEISQVEEVPEGMITETIPSQKYAVFTHIGSLINIQKTHQYINEEWLLNNPRYERVPFAAEFEWYDARFSLVSEASELDLYIPIQEK